mmetsp:Transcript_6674/g.6538  ORF Transcript_6674/g.6538 Transcript_6674/m.6538 type:complete len:996 (+) Transcript_6674:218-3205(+)
MFNITNPDEIMQGAKPKLVETPEFRFREYSRLNYWEYLDENETSLGNETSGPYIAYNYQLILKEIENEGTVMPLDTPITSLNIAQYFTFYSMTHQAFPFYSLHSLYDVVIAMQNDLYDIIIAYVLYDKFYSNTAAVEDYLTNVAGFSQADANAIMTDTKYGWTGYNQMKLWIQAAFDYNSTKTLSDGAFETLDNYFQIQNLGNLVVTEGILWQNITVVLEDMERIYGTSDRVAVGNLQWATAAVTNNPPLGVQKIPPTPTYNFSSFLTINQTFTFPPEMPIFIAAAKLKEADYSQIANTLLEVSHTIPKTNYMSLVSLSNLITFFTDIAGGNLQDLNERFNLTTYNQGYNLAAYLQYMATLKITYEGTTTNYDGYSLWISRLVTKAIQTGINNLKNDVYWALPAKLLFCKYKEFSTSCKSVIGNGLDPQQYATQIDAICADPDIGWDINTPSSWINLEIWAKAALKHKPSYDYNIILNKNIINAATLDTILANNFEVPITTYMQSISQKYGCAKAICTFDELLYKQWGSSVLTNNLMEALTTCGVSSSMTFQSWLPSRYLTPIEWAYFSETPIPAAMVGNFLNYNAFLNPTPLKLFLNYYFQGNTALITKTFGIPSSLIDPMYNYLLKLLPGYGLFATRTYQQWIYGVPDTFLAFVKSIDVYNGGYPLVPVIYPLKSFANETQTSPKHVVYSGKTSTKHTKAYYKYFGHRTMDMYSAKYSDWSPYQAVYAYSQVWGEEIEIEGGDGGNYGTHVHKDDRIPVFISSILRYGILTYKFSDTYNGLDVYFFHVDPDELKTSATVPANAKYFQLPNGFDGFFNISAQSGAPCFVSFPHCLYCEADAQNMVEYYEWTPEAPLSKRIYPYETHDMPWAKIEPYTGTGVSVVLNFEISGGIYRDYFYRNLHEPVPGKGLYFPYYQLLRSSNLTDSQVDKLFGSFILAQQMKSLMFYVGVTLGACMILISMFNFAYVYRKQKFGGWKSPRFSASPPGSPKATD